MFVLTRCLPYGKSKKMNEEQQGPVAVAYDVSSLFVLSHCVSCVSAWRFLYHVTVSCKGSIVNVLYTNMIAVTSCENQELGDAGELSFIYKLGLSQ